MLTRRHFIITTAAMFSAPVVAPSMASAAAGDWV